MRNRLAAIAAACALAAATTVEAQTPAAPAQAAPAPAGDSVIVVEKPTYTSIPLETPVNRPAAEVWKRIGKLLRRSASGSRFPKGCTITAGKDGEFGAVRSVANEVLVGKTELSYTYTQPVRAGRPYNLYHGTLEARPVTRHDLEAGLHAGLRQLDAARRRGAGEGQGAANRDVHARARRT